jgi:hypothetical protein
MSTIWKLHFEALHAVHFQRMLIIPSGLTRPYQKILLIHPRQQVLEAGMVSRQVCHVLARFRRWAVPGLDPMRFHSFFRAQVGLSLLFPKPRP